MDLISCVLILSLQEGIAPKAQKIFATFFFVGFILKLKFLSIFEMFMILFKPDQKKNAWEMGKALK